MKSFFQRLHDSQPGTSRSRIKDASYKQWMPSSKPEKDRGQPSNGAESSANPYTKLHTTRTDASRPNDLPYVDALGRVTTDYATRFSTVPGLSSSRNAQKSAPLSQLHPAGPSKAHPPKPPDNVKDDAKPPVKRENTPEVSGNEKDAPVRVKADRPSRLGKAATSSASQQHPIWIPPDSQVSSNEKGKKRDRPREHGPGREMEGNERRRVEAKEKERGTKEPRRDRVGRNKAREVEKKQQEGEPHDRDFKDYNQIREREWRERERFVRERRERDREGKESGRDKDKEWESEQPEKEQKQKEHLDRDVKERQQREREREERERERERREREQQEREQREKERRERREKEHQERQRREKERREQEQLERERREEERREREQRERERRQEEKWEREQREIERKYRERLQKEAERKQAEQKERERDRKEQRDSERKEKELQRKEFERDPRELDLLQVERERQEQRKRERELWEEQLERDREERDRRWRNERLHDNPELRLTEIGAAVKHTSRPRNKDRTEGIIGSDREQGKTSESDKRQAAHVPQNATPPSRPDRGIQDGENIRSTELVKNQHSYNGVVDPLSTERQSRKHTTREDGHASEASQRVLPATTLHDSTRRNGIVPEPARNPIHSSSQPHREAHTLAPPTTIILTPHLSSAPSRVMSPAPPGPGAPSTATVGLVPSVIHASGCVPRDSSNLEGRSTGELTQIAHSNHLTASLSRPELLPQELHRAAVATTKEISNPGHTSSRAAPPDPPVQDSLPTVIITQNTYSNHSSVRPPPPDPSALGGRFLPVSITSQGHSSPSGAVPPNPPARETSGPSDALTYTLPPDPPAQEGYPLAKVATQDPYAAAHALFPAQEGHSSGASLYPARNAEFSAQQNSLTTAAPLPQGIHTGVPSHNVLLEPQGHQKYPAVKTPSAGNPPARVEVSNPSSEETMTLSYDTRESRNQARTREGKEGDTAPILQSQLDRETAPTPTNPDITISRAKTSKRTSTPPVQPEPLYHQIIAPTSDKILVQPLNMASQSRSSPHSDKTPLQAFIPSTCRTYLKDRSNNQDTHAQEFIRPTTPVTGFHDSILDHGQQGYGNPRPILQQGAEGSQHPEHHRHHHEGNIVQRGGKPSPRSQTVEKLQQFMPFEPRQGAIQFSATAVELTEDRGKVPNVAPHAQAEGSIGATSRKRYTSEVQPTASASAGNSAVQANQQSCRPDAGSVSVLVSHYERMDEAARVGSPITRPGTILSRPEVANQSQRELVPGLHRDLSGLENSRIDRSTIAVDPHSSPPGTTQPQSVQLTAPRPDRTSKFDARSYPVHHSGIHPALLEPALDHTISQQNTGGRYSSAKVSRATSENQALTANDYLETSGRNPADIPAPSQSNPRSEQPVVTETTLRAASRAAPGKPSGDLFASNTLAEGIMEGRQQAMLSSYEHRAQVHQHTGSKKESDLTLQQLTYPNDSTVRGFLPSHPSSVPHQREGRPSRNQPAEGSKPLTTKENPVEAPQTGQSKSQSHLFPGGHRVAASISDSRYIPQRVEDLHQAQQLTETTYLAPPSSQMYPPEMSASTSLHTYPPTQGSSPGERRRSKHIQSNSSPHPQQRSPLMSTDGTSVSPQRTGNSVHPKMDEEPRPRGQRAPTQIKHEKLAELLSSLPSGGQDVPHQSYLHDARRNLASRLEQQTDGPSNWSTGTSSGNTESSRLRSSSGRGDHSPGHPRGGASPSGPSSSSTSFGHNPDPSAKDYNHTRSSPVISQHTPSPRVRAVATEGNPDSGLQSVTQQRDEASRYAPGLPPHRPPSTRGKEQEPVSNIEDINSRKPHNAVTQATYDIKVKTDDTNRTSNAPVNPILQQYSGRSISQRDGQRTDSHIPPQRASTAHSRSRSESQNPHESSATHPRYPSISPRETHNAALSQAQSLPHGPPPNLHHPPSVPPVATSESSDQMQRSRSHSINHSQASTTREESQAPQMRSTPSRKSTPLPPETRHPSSASAPQSITPKTYEIWLPPTSQHDQPLPRTIASQPPRRERGQDRDEKLSKIPQRHPSPTREALPIHPSAPDQQVFNPFHYLKTRKIRTMSIASMEAQDGTAPTVIGSPTASVLSQAPIYIPPVQDPIVAAREWSIASARQPGQRIRRPGVVWAQPEDPPTTPYEHRRSERPRSSHRRPRSSGSRSRETSDTDQPS